AEHLSATDERRAVVQEGVHGQGQSDQGGNRQLSSAREQLRQHAFGTAQQSFLVKEILAAVRGKPELRKYADDRSLSRSLADQRDRALDVEHGVTDANRRGGHRDTYEPVGIQVEEARCIADGSSRSCHRGHRRSGNCGEVTALSTKARVDSTAVV